MDYQEKEVVTKYLEMMDQQREQLFQIVNELEDRLLWQRPTSDQWSIGENLDHLRVINTSTLTLIKITWLFLLPLAKLRYDHPYETEIDNVYKRPGFPLHTGWIWSPKHTPRKPTSLKVLKDNLVKTHQEIRNFFSGKDADYLGHVSLYDPVMGWLNLIKVLRVGIYHDKLHEEQIEAALQRIRL